MFRKSPFLSYKAYLCGLKKPKLSQLVGQFSFVNEPIY